MYNTANTASPEAPIRIKLTNTVCPNLAAFYHEYENAYPENPMDPFQRIIGGALVEIQRSQMPGAIHLNFIKSLEQGKGHAHKALVAVTTLADKFQLPITAHVHPCIAAAVDKKNALRKKALKEWYARHGFEKWPDYYDHIVRYPK